jgi:hypothetical protein
MKIETPAFKNEAEEAKWWFDNQNLVAEKFEHAAKNGMLQTRHHDETWLRRGGRRRVRPSGWMRAI